MLYYSDWSFRGPMVVLAGQLARKIIDSAGVQATCKATKRLISCLARQHAKLQTYGCHMGSTRSTGPRMRYCSERSFGARLVVLAGQLARKSLITVTAASDLAEPLPRGNLPPGAPTNTLC